MNARIAGSILFMLAFIFPATLAGEVPARGDRGNDPAIEQRITAAVENALPGLHANAHIKVTSWNGRVLITGQVPDNASRKRILALLRQEALAVSVHDALVVAPPANPGTRFGDALVAARVKFRLLFGADVPASEIKLVVEDRVVYLMGLLNAAQAERAIAATQRSGGIRKIVTVFDAPPTTKGAR